MIAHPISTHPSGKSSFCGYPNLPNPYTTAGGLASFSDPLNRSSSTGSALMIRPPQIIFVLDAGC
jgi:hypothetical protein